MKFVHPEHGSLIFIKQDATSNFWDTHWKARTDTRQVVPKAGKNSLVTKITEKYLRPENGAILEGGCGRGNYVFALKELGYDCTGLDYAKETVEDLNQSFPELKIVYGDVRKLPFPDDAFIGYWSLGVIEHFWDGYDPIASEMARVIKRGGYLFLTFPQMSWLRRVRVALGFYEPWLDVQKKPEHFYQFALSAKQVIGRFKELGFEVVETRQKDGLKGTKDELSRFKPLLQRIYDFNGKNIIMRIIRKVLEVTLTPFAGHSILIVLRLKDKT